MIIVRLFGGLGNQLFIYTYSTWLSENTKQSLYFDTNSGFSNDFIYKRTNNLEYLGINLKKDKSFFSKNILVSNFLRIILRKYFTKENILNIYCLNDKNHNKFDIKILSKSKFIFVEGYFNTNIYAYNKSFILSKLNNNVIFNNVPYSELNFKDSVAIHYRSYNDVPNSDKITNLKLNSTYYEEAINYIYKNIKTPYFFIFSDDIKEAKNIIRIQNAFFIENDNLDKPSHIKDFLLMIKCNHHIIANSTFSWWTAYLNIWPNKIIIRPNDIYNQQSDTFYKKSWIII